MPQPKENVGRRALVYDEYRDDFIIWIKNRVTLNHAKDAISNLDRYLREKVITSPLEIAKIRNSASSKKQVTVAIRNLLNYCEEMDLLDEDFIMKLRKPLKTIKSNPDNFIPSDEQVVKAYGEIINPRFMLVFKLLAMSGLRIVEAVEFFRIYDPKKVVINGNVARFSLFYLRKNKKSYFVYFPKAMFEEIHQMDIRVKGFKQACYRVNLPAKYLRKWNYNFLIMHNVPESVADFIQGRSPVSVGSMHYLAKVKQADYWYAQVVDEIVKVFEP